jgi:two-component system sensor histidine kinase BaeS
MTVLRRIGLRGRLALALAGVAVVSVALATVLADRGLDSRLDQFARDRLHATATHSAELAAGYFRRDGHWTPGAATQLRHLAAMNGYGLVLYRPSGRPVGAPSRLPSPRARAPVLVGGQAVGAVAVAPLRGEVLTGEDRTLHDRLNSLHLLAGALALTLGLLAAVLVAPALARPLRRLTGAARRIAEGELDARVAPGGAPEVRELGQAFNRLAETLEREEEIRRDAAADIAHELRTPITGVLSRIEAAQDGVLTDERANLEAMHTEALRLAQLVEDLGELADAQRPGLTLQKEPLDLTELVGRRAGVYREYLQAKGVALDERLEPARTYGDPRRIAQIVDNLLSNALRYTDAGTVTIELAERDGGAVLEVADTGSGIEGEDLPYIFERFWRSERSRARKTGGAGIGLAIVRELVRAHDGRIDVESKPGQGSRFRVTLPGPPPGE